MNSTHHSRANIKQLTVSKRKHCRGRRGHETRDSAQRCSTKVKVIVTKSKAQLILASTSKQNGFRGDNKQHQESHSCQQTCQGSIKHVERLHSNKICQRLVGVNTTTFGKIRGTGKPGNRRVKFGAECEACGAVAVTKTLWKSHQAAHQSKGTYCKYCCLVFLTTHGRNLHQKLHQRGHIAKVSDYCECRLCGGSFINIIYLEFHLLELHGQDALHNPKCFILHPAYHPQHPPKDVCKQHLFRCGVCCLKFIFSSNLDCHMAIHTRKSYACNICDFEYPSLEVLVNHSKQHLTNTTSAQDGPVLFSPPSTQDNTEGGLAVQHHLLHPSVLTPIKMCRTKPRDWLDFCVPTSTSPRITIPKLSTIPTVASFSKFTDFRFSAIPSLHTISDCVTASNSVTAFTIGTSIPTTSYCTSTAASGFIADTVTAQTMTIVSSSRSCSHSTASRRTRFILPRGFSHHQPCRITFH